MDEPKRNGQADLDHGFTRIANELLEAMCAMKLPGEAQRVFLAIVRLTYGWKRSESIIGYSQLQKMTNLHRRSVRRAVETLYINNVITVRIYAHPMRNNAHPPANSDFRMYKINKNTALWGQKDDQNGGMRNNAHPMRIYAHPLCAHMRTLKRYNIKESAGDARAHEGGVDYEHPLQEFIATHESFEKLRTMPQQISKLDCEYIVDKYEIGMIKRVLEQMENKFDQYLSRSRSVGASLKRWLEVEAGRK